MTTSTRATLLERLRDGADALAWDEFFARYGSTIYGFARHRGCSPHTAEEIVQEEIPKTMRRLAARTKLWILWRKGSDVTQPFLRESAGAVGLVDYKICAVDAVWSAMLFARRKTNLTKAV